MVHIAKIIGINLVIENKLREQGVTTTGALLDLCGSAQGRRQLSTFTGLAEDLILDWVNRADLMRIKGIGEEYSDLLEQAGVDTVKELRCRNPDNLYETIQSVNAEKHLVRRLPAKSDVKRWINHAKELPPLVSY